MFRKPPPTASNPPSKPATTQAPTKTPIITRGNVASLVQLHDTRVREQEAAAAPPALSRTGTGRGKGRAETIRDVPGKSPASRMSSWKPQFQESKADPSPFQNRRKSLEPRQSAIPRGHSPIAQPSRRAGAHQHREPPAIHRERQSRRSITGIHAQDQYAWQQDSQDMVRTDPWSRRASGHRKASLPHGQQSSSFSSRFEPPYSSHPPPASKRRDSWVRRSLRPPKVQPMSDDSIPSMSDSDQEWSLEDRESDHRPDWTTRRTSSERSRSSYADSRQGLFYGDLSPPQPPAPPQVSPTMPVTERTNPFKRRNSSGSTMRSSSPLAKRESISHKAFERVRSMSPPSINEDLEVQTPAPQRPPEPSIATYITRKLSQYWTETPPDSMGSPPPVRVPPSSPLPVHHIDSFLVQDILSSIDSVLTEHTTALQTVITKSHQLLHEKERLCPSVSPRRSPKAMSPVRLSPAHSVKSVYSSRSASPRSPSLEDPPKLLRRRTTSVPKILQLIDSTASDMGLAVAVDKRDSVGLARKIAAERRGSIPKSITEPDLTLQNDIETPTMARASSAINRKASRTVTPPRIRVSEEGHPLQPPNTRTASPGGACPALTEEHLALESQRGSTLPTLSVLTPSTPSNSTASPLTSVHRFPMSTLQRLSKLIPSEEVDDRHSSQLVNPPSGQSAVSPGGQSIITPSEYMALESRPSSPSMFTQSNMPTPSDEYEPVMMDPTREYDRDAALVQRATRNSVNSVPSSVPTTPYRQISPTWNQSTLPLEPFEPALVRKPTSTVVSGTIEAVMEPEPVRSGEGIDSRVSRSRKRQVSDPSQLQRSERKSSHYDRARNETQTSSYHSTSSEVLSASPGPRVAETRTSMPHGESSEDDIPHIPSTEPLRRPAESTKRIPRPPMRSFKSRIPSPWDHQKSLGREGGEEREHQEKPTPDHGPRGQFWTSHRGAEMERKWFGRHRSGEGQPGHGDDFVP